MDDVLFSQGLVLMLVGIGTVLLFLILLWGVLSVGGRILQSIFKSSDSGDQTPEDDAALAVAIAMAVKAKRDLVFSPEGK